MSEKKNLLDAAKVLTTLVHLEKPSFGPDPKDFVTLAAEEREFDLIINYSKIRYEEIKSNYEEGKEFKSHIHTDKKDRLANLKRNVMTGQACEWALNKYVSGSSQGYVSHREGLLGMNFASDHGSDAPGLPYDVKGRYWDLEQNGRKISPGFNLWVRPKEYHKNWFYILAVMYSNWSVQDKKIWVSLLGWAHSKDLEKTKDPDGRTRYERKLRELRRMEDLPKYPVTAQIMQLKSHL